MMVKFLLVAVICSFVCVSKVACYADWRGRVVDSLDKQDYVHSAPLIGVLTQPHGYERHKEEQTISGPLVSWIESAGGRVVPIRYNAPWEEIDEAFSAIHGLVLPGGSGKLWYGHPFFDTAAYLFEKAKSANDNGDVFPVFGICLGFETLHILIANMTRENLLIRVHGQESTASTLELRSSAAASSVFFHRWDDLQLMELSQANLKPAFNAHVWAVPPDAYDQIQSLQDELTILSTSRDTSGVEYISTVEGRKYPWFATQWHPEKTPYEFTDKTIPHSRTAIQTAWLAASVFVDVARLNNHSISYKKQVKIMIDNYHRHFLAADGTERKSEPLPDTLWFIPNPKSPRKYSKSDGYGPGMRKRGRRNSMVNSIIVEE